jgi:hypothetical protein
VGITLVEVEVETVKIRRPLVIEGVKKGRRLLHRSSTKKKKQQARHKLKYHRVDVWGPMDVSRLLF